MSRARARIWFVVALRLAVSVFVRVVCAALGAPAPTGTPPTAIGRAEAMSLERTRPPAYTSARRQTVRTACSAACMVCEGSLRSADGPRSPTTVALAASGARACGGRLPACVSGGRRRRRAIPHARSAVGCVSPRHRQAPQHPAGHVPRCPALRGQPRLRREHQEARCDDRYRPLRRRPRRCGLDRGSRGRAAYAPAPGLGGSAWLNTV
jgi:hypothetical protein